jgi:DNA end-binding protein Ku
MRAIWKGTISFGLVNIPIALGLATKRSDPSFRTLDRESLQPVKQQLFAPARGEVVDRDDTVKGFEVSKDSYLPITDEELDSVAVERRRTIDILAFVDAAEVDPVYFDRSYYLEPQEHAQKPYSLLVQAMKESGKAALGKIVISSKEYLALLRPSGDALVIELLFYPEDVRDKEEIEEGVRDTEVSEEELNMARQLVDSLSRPFEPERYENEHKRLVLELVERKLAGEEVPVPAEEPEPQPVPDLMAALKASIDQAKGSDGAPGPEDSGDGSGDGASKRSSRRSAQGKGGGGSKSRAKKSDGAGNARRSTAKS